MGVEWQSLLKVFNEWALEEYGQRDDINWLDIDGKSLKNTLKNPNNEQQNFIMFVSLFSQESGLVLHLKRIENKKGSEIDEGQAIIEDLRAAAAIIKGKKVDANTRMMVVPGSARVRLQAESEGLDKVFLEAGAEWRSAGCSMCLGMNPDQLKPGERSASTSNRNFEGRQGKGGRTHLVSPLVAAATAIRGTLSSPADL